MVDLCNLHEVAGDFASHLANREVACVYDGAEMLAEFVARYNRENKRCFLSAKASGKLVCPHSNENGRLTFLGEKGMLQHYRRMHRQRFYLNLCKHLFKVKHYEETVEMLKQLSLYRRDSERDLKDFQIKAKSCGDLLLAGKTKREAVKLAALAFKHRGNVKHLGSEPLLIEVIEKFNLDDHLERFHAWYLDSGEIHVESVFVRKVRVMPSHMMFFILTEGILKMTKDVPSSSSVLFRLYILQVTHSIK